MYCNCFQCLLFISFSYITFKNVKICLPLFVKNSTPTNPPAKKITNIRQLCIILLPHMQCSRLVIFHLIFAIIEFSFSGLLEAFKYLLVRNEQHEFQSKESKSTLSNLLWRCNVCPSASHQYLMCLLECLGVHIRAAVPHGVGG